MKTIHELTSRLEELGHKIYREPWELNLVFIRTSQRFTNKFDDEAYWFWWNDKGELGFKSAKCTTKAGFYYALHPMGSNGTAILKEQQYLDSWKLGLHHSDYAALVQAKPISVWRDNNKDSKLDNRAEETGSFYINIHRASKNKESMIVGNWSAACIVLANPIMFQTLIRAVNQQLTLGKRDVFSPTILKNF
jgi:hypothetical protein